MDKWIQGLPSLWDSNGWGTTLYALLVLACAALLTGLIGLEREKHGYSAGLRTHMLVGLGSCLFTIISAYAFPNSDQARIAAQVVTGIGFIGAGTIIQNGLNIKGLTTAATLWFVAAIGMCCGSGLVSVGILGTLTGLIVLIIFKLFEDKHPKKKVFRLAYLIPKGEMSLSKAISAMDGLNVMITDIDIGSAVHENQKCTKVVMTFKIKDMSTKADVMDRIVSAISPIAMEELN